MMTLQDERIAVLAVEPRLVSCAVEVADQCCEELRATYAQG